MQRQRRLPPQRVDVHRPQEGFGDVVFEVDLDVVVVWVGVVLGVCEVYEGVCVFMF